VSPGLRVLLVCTANVCRSRTAELLLRHRLSSAEVTAELASAGVRAVAGAPACAVMDALLRERDLAMDATMGARRVSRELLEEQDLVLVPERAHRAALARLLPAGRARTFTFREAAALADALPATGDAGGAEIGERDRLLERIRSMDRARGTVVLPVAADRPSGGRVRAALLGRRPAADPLDVEDVHGGSLKEHGAALAVIDESLDRLVSGLTR